MNGILAESCWYGPAYVHNATGAQQVHCNVTILKIVFENSLCYPFLPSG